MSINLVNAQKEDIGMTHMKFFIRLTVFLSLVSFAALPLYAGEYNEAVDIGAAMPSFSELPATDGNTLSSAQIKESVVVLVFLANHCPWVKGSEKDLIDLVNHFKGKDVRIVGVSVNRREDDRLEAMKKHAAEAGYNFTYVFDESQELGRKLGAARTPEYFVFDKERKLVYTGLLHNSPSSMRSDGSINYTKGEPTQFYVKDAIEAVLAGKPVPVRETRAQGCNVEYEKTGS
jgi:peroxiredoxin